MIVKIEVIISIDPQTFNNVFSSYGAAWNLNFSLELTIRWLFSAFDTVMKPSKNYFGVFLKLTESMSDEQAYGVLWSA